jgi:hypothetical protein
VERGREEEWKAKTGASRQAGQSVPVVAVFMAGTGLPEFFQGHERTGAQVRERALLLASSMEKAE